MWWKFLVMVRQHSEYTKNHWIVLFCVCVCVCGTGIWTQVLHLKLLHQTFFVLDIFRDSLTNNLPGLASNNDPSDLCLLSS
jgi:hypothetical protein